jgi:sugar phosphate isomerase/epimerase
MTGKMQTQFELMKERVRSTHIHDNNGEDDQHLFPGQGTIDWSRAMQLLAAHPDQYPLLLELREPSEMERPIEQAKRAADGLLASSYSHHYEL